MSYIVTSYHYRFCATILTYGSLYEGESISNQPIQFPMDRDGHDFHALYRAVIRYLYLKGKTGKKIHGEQADCLWVFYTILY